MMKIVQLTIFLVVILEVACMGQVIYADFDDLSSGVGVADHYKGMYVRSFVTSLYWARSAPNVLYVGGVNFLEFSTGTSWLSFYTYGDYVVDAYDTDGGYLGSRAISSGNQWQLVELGYDRPISRIDVTRGPYANYIDDLTYEIVPEPASLASLAGMIGLFGLGCRRRARSAKA